MPTKPSSPGLSLNLAIGAFLGLMAGGAVGGYRELRDRYFRTTEQIRNELGLECLGLVPVVKDRTLRVSKLGKGADDRATRPSHSITNYVVEQPLSQFAEAMRGVKVTAEATVSRQGTRTIGIVSAMPGEGKSVVAANLAAHLASQGSRTLLVDGDFRNPASTRALAPHATTGLAEALVTNGPIDTLLYSDATSGLKFLPAVASHSVAHASNLLASDAIDRLLDTREFDYVILDLPPIGPVVDAKALARKLDCFVFVVEWGRTPRRLVRGLLQSEWMVAEKCLGVVLNKVDLKRLTRYQENMGASYYGYYRHQ
jgi:succinoglycan biosynthesis transport protein ExoP